MCALINIGAIKNHSKRSSLIIFRFSLWFTYFVLISFRIYQFASFVDLRIFFVVVVVVFDDQYNFKSKMQSRLFRSVNFSTFAQSNQNCAREIKNSSSISGKVPSSIGTLLNRSNKRSASNRYPATSNISRVFTLHYFPHIPNYTHSILIHGNV